jgi:LSD1 subclass zinc finger protein
MPVITCPGCSRPLQLPDVPSSRPVICVWCNTRIEMPLLPSGRTVDPGIPTPGPLPAMRLPKLKPPGSAGPAAPTGREGEGGERGPDSDGGFNTNRVIVILVVLTAAAGLALVLLL